MKTQSRRRFLTSAGAAAVGAAVVPRSAWATPMGLPVGIQLYTVGKPLEDDPAGTLKQLHAIGYREVETAGIGKKTTAKEMRKLLDDAGLKCPSAHLPLTEPDLGPLFEQAKTLGATYAVSSVLRSFDFLRPQPGAKPPDMAHLPALPPLGIDGFKKTAEKMNEVGTKAKAAGLQYTYHNHNFEFEKMPDGNPGYDVLLKETDPELVKFEIDCGWMVVAGYQPVTYFTRYAGRFRMLHIKDFAARKPTTDLIGPDHPSGRDLGTGFVDYKPIFAASKQAGIEHIFVEQEMPFPVSRMESAKADFAYLQKFS